MKSATTALDRLRLPTQATQRSGESDADQEGWMVSYADLITLLFIFFAVMLSISSISRAKFDLLSKQFNQASQSSLTELKKHLDEEIQRQQLQGQVQTEISDEGLQIRFSEKVLFASGAASLGDSGAQMLGQFARVLAGMQESYRIAVEGHTDSRPIHTSEFPSNWSLSATRSVNVLHFLAAHGLRQNQMMVRAYADTRPLAAAPATDTSRDRRVTLLVY